MDYLSIQRLEELFSSDGYQCYLEEPKEQGVLSKLHIFFGNDYKGRPITLDLCLKDQVLSENPVKDQAKDGKQPFFALEFYSILPLRLSDYAIAETGRYLAFINCGTEFPGFQMNEIEGRIEFRYLHLGRKDAWDSQCLRSIVGMIAMHLLLFTEDIESVACGAATTVELLEKGLEKVYVKR